MDRSTSSGITIAFRQSNAAPKAGEMPRTTVSVVICTRLRSAALRKCLNAIRNSERSPDEIIIVDNSTGDKNAEALGREFSAEYLIEPNVGLSRARNLGLCASQSEVVAFVDDDALPDEHWLGRIIAPFSDNQVALVTGSVMASGSNRAFRPQSDPLFLNKANRHWFEIAAFGGLGIGTNMAIRKSACAGDLFDERLGRGAPFGEMEEHHAFAQILSRGHSAVHIPEAIVFHISQNPLEVARLTKVFAYITLLFWEFPDSRRDLLSFLSRRVKGKSLAWPRNSPDRGMVLDRSWWVLLKASFAGFVLYVRTRKSQQELDTRSN